MLNICGQYSESGVDHASVVHSYMALQTLNRRDPNSATQRVVVLSCSIYVLIAKVSWRCRLVSCLRRSSASPKSAGSRESSCWGRGISSISRFILFSLCFAAFHVLLTAEERSCSVAECHSSVDAEIATNVFPTVCARYSSCLRNCGTRCAGFERHAWHYLYEVCSCSVGKLRSPLHREAFATNGPALVHQVAHVTRDSLHGGGFECCEI